jgi:uncharacterized RDD family membrane protein YckC
MTAAVPFEPPAEALPSVAYASWGRRLAAWILDYFIFAFLIVVPLTIWNPSGDAQGWLYFFFWPAAVILFGTYFIGFHGGRRGQTPGKRLLGIAVRDEQTFQRIGYMRAFGRLMVTVVLWSFLWVPGILDALWPLWDSRKRSLHDRAVGSIVVRV